MSVTASGNRETKQSKHIDIRYNWIKDNIEKRNIIPVFVSTSNNKVDIFTKSLPSRKFDEKVEDLE